jgi:hypothetical protein
MATDEAKSVGTCKQPIKRSPRLIRGQEAAAIELLSRVAPQFEVRLIKETDGTAATELVFVVPVPNELRESYSALYRLICGPRATDWENAIADGFRTTKYNGKKPLSDFITPQLRRAFAAGVRIWLKKMRDVGNREIGRLEQELIDFDKQTKMKSGPQPDLRAALWAAKRLDQLVPAIKKLRSGCKDRSSVRKEELKSEIEKLCAYETYIKVMKELLSQETGITPWMILTPEINVQEIAFSVVTAELPTSGHIVDLNKTSLRTLVKLGRKLVKSLDRVPKPRI